MPLPEGVAGVSYYRPRRNLFVREDTNGFLSFENIGYAVIMLERQPDESLQPEFVAGNLTARIEYGTSGNFGVQLNERLVPVLTEDDWRLRYQEFGFMDGRGFLRVEDLDGESARVSVYRDQDTRIDSFTIRKGEQTIDRYLPGSYCSSGYRINLQDVRNVEEHATILFDGDEYDVFKGSTFADTCRVIDLQDNGFGTGSVRIKCSGTQTFSLEIGHKPVVLNFQSADQDASVGDRLFDSGNEGVYLGGIGRDVTVENGNTFVVLVKSREFSKALERDVNRLIADMSRGRTEASAKELYLKGFEVAVIAQGNSRTFEGEEITFRDFSTVEDFDVQSAEFDKYFDLAVEGYKAVEDDYGALEYPFDLPDNHQNYGEASISQAISLARSRGQIATELEFENIAADGIYSVDINRKFSNQFTYDEAVHQFEIDGFTHTISLEKVTGLDSDKTSVRVFVDGNAKTLQKSGEYLIDPSDEGRASIQLDAFDDDSITVIGNCNNRGSNKVTIGLGNRRAVCDHDIRVSEINVEQLAKLRITPVNRHTGGLTNLSYAVGIEQRAIELSPEKSLERIAKLNKTINDLNNINDNLGKVVEAGKAACFATTAALQVKSLVSGVGGKAIARDTVMRGVGGWNDICQERVDNGEYISPDVCFKENSGNIEGDVNAVTEIIRLQNDESKGIDEKYKVGDRGILGGGGIDSDSAYEEYFEVMQDRYVNSQVAVVNEDGENEIKVSDVVGNLDRNSLTREELREIDLHLRVLANNPSDSLKELYERELYNSLQPLRQDALDNIEKNSYTNTLESSGIANVGDVEIASSNRKALVGKYDGEVATQAIGDIEANAFVKPIIYNGERYLLNLSSVDGTRFTINRNIDGSGGVFDANGNPADADTDRDIRNIFREFRRYDSGTYQNQFKDPKVRYYETEPYKGMPAIVPFDLADGWYAGTKQTLPVFNQQPAFQDSGRINSFWICNVDGDGRESFTSGFGDDICQQFNLYTGQPLDQFPGLDESETRRLVSSAIQALEQAANQHRSGITEVTILGKRIEVGNPASSIPGTRCQDFMSPSDCQLMFNVCDPVICPSSRCDLGGRYQVDDVVQTGIVGSVFMCLPNAKEGIAVPICLTGVHAGVDNFVSILEASRDCLQESVDTGQYVGICDQITAVYKCEFFWNQVAPGINTILPKLLERVTGAGVRGGGEYLNAQAAWQNMQGSIDYFKDQYAVNALRAFRIRSTQEVGTPICKAFVSVRFPDKLKALIEPDSPHQFSAWFDEIPHSSATTPAISQYKVFYHIYAGNDQGLYYSVYLKDPVGSSFIQSTGAYFVDTGFVGRGEFVSEARDFTAPGGFRELCVRINGVDKCGFKQVSTSFALNYIRDEYVQGQLNQTDITSENECISGSPNALALVNPNIQSGVEEAVTPQIYERGIVRVCGTDNPGSSTSPERWIRVGFCGDTKIGCWLDRESVDNALSPENIGARNQTLADLDALAGSVIARDSGFQTVESGGGQSLLFREVEQSIDNLQGLDFEEAEKESRSIFATLAEIENKYQLLESDFARIFFNKAWTYDQIARKAPFVERIVEDVEPSAPEPETPITDEPREVEEINLVSCRDFKDGDELSVEFDNCITVEGINGILELTPAKDTGQLFYDFGVEYNIDPVIALAFFNHESNFGTRGVATRTKSVGNIRYSSSCPGINLDGWCAYSSWDQSIEHWYQLIRSNVYAGSGLNTVEKIIPKYAPASENDVDAYISSVRNFVLNNRDLSPIVV